MEPEGQTGRRWLILADDLTGAAEVAAHAFTMGLPATVHLDTHSGDWETGGVEALDTNTRRLRPEAAGERMAEIVAGIDWGTPGLSVGKKVDSMLRGNILAEVWPILQSAATPYKRVLLVANNPGMGRVIRNGRYSIDGISLQETPLAGDPDHPRNTDDVIALLGPAGTLPVACVQPGQMLPEAGIIIGEAASQVELDHWAGRLDGSTLPAGGAEFLSTVFRVHRVVGGTQANDSTGGYPPVELFISGSTAPAAEETFDRAQANGIPSFRVAAEDWIRFSAERPCFERLLREVADCLKQGRRAMLRVGKERVKEPDASARISGGIVAFLDELRVLYRLRHLYAEGGATAAEIVRHFSWNSLRVVRVHSPGAVTLKIGSHPDTYVSMKPGSYAFPPSLWI